MDSKEEATAEGHRHIATTDSSGGSTTTMALQRKRARRVSFAEMTSVHFFDRDEEDNETPLAKAAKMDGFSANELDFGLELEQSKEIDDEEIDVDEMEMPRSFLRPLGSPSPGGSTIGSASSNDEDSFFGPVSASFIRPGRLSDSAASDDIHDVTMDSTAFSIHFRSLAKSESGGDLKTPTVGQLCLEDNTPMIANVFSSVKKLSPKSSSPISKLSSSHNSNEMCFVVENLNRYEYEKLSPGLDALLAESEKNLLSATAPDDVTTSKSPKSVENESLSLLNHGDDIVSLRNYARKEQGVTWSHDKAIGNASDVSSKLEKADRILGGVSPKRSSPNAFDVTARRTSDYKLNPSIYQLSKDEYESPLVLSKSPIKQQMLLMDNSPRKDLEMVSSLRGKPNSFLRIESIEHQDTETPIQQSISKLELMEKSSFYSAFSSRVDNTVIKTLEFVKSPHKNCNIFKSDLMKDIVTQEKLTSACQSKELKNHSCLDNDTIESLKHGGENLLEEHLGYLPSGKTPNSLSARKLSSVLKYGQTAGSNSKHGLLTRKSSEDVLMTKTESSLAEIASSTEDKAIVTPSKLVSSRGKILDKMFLASQRHQFNQSKDLMSQNHLKQFMDFDKDQGIAPKENLADPNLSTETGNIDVVALGMKTSSNLPTFEVSHFKRLIVLEATDGREIDNKENFGSTGNFTILDEDNKSRVMHPKTPERGIKNCTNTSRFANNLAGEELIAILGGTTSPSPWENLNEVNLQKRSLKCQRGQSSHLELLEYPNDGDMETMIGQERNHWTNIFSKFSEDTKQLVFGSDCEFNFKMFDVVGDLLVHLKKSKLYETLFIDAVPKSTSVLHDLQIERVTETNIMLTQIVLEKAKLQLNHLKRVTLLKRLQLLSSRTQESQVIRTDMASRSMEISTSDVRVHAVGNQSVSVYPNEGNERHVCHKKLVAMRSALEASERKISILNRNFRTSFKIRTVPGCDDTIALVNEHFMKRAYCRFIRLDMQMWVVHSVDSMNYQHNIVLNYLGLVVQSIKVVVGPTASTSFSFKANDRNLMKNFSYMDACTAVEFVFNAETKCKYAGSKTLVREIQVTSSRLGTLLDVFEEVQLAQIEFQNLTESSFCSPYVEQLVLKLCFYSSIAERKVILELDMSCLKRNIINTFPSRDQALIRSGRGIYPSEILPFQIALPPDDQKCLSSESILDEIKDALKSLKTGYMRILRLCSCVSQVVQAATSI